MLITFVIWANNCSLALQKNLQQLFNSKNLSFFEVVIIEDASDDETGAVATNFLQKYPKNVQVIYSRTNMGISNAYRYGLELAKSKYIYFLNSNGYISSLKNLDLLKHFLEDQNYPDIIEVPVKYLWGNRTSQCRLEQTNYGPTIRNPELLANIHPLLFSKFIKIQLLKSNNISFNRFHFYPGYFLYVALLNAQSTVVFRKIIFSLESFDTSSSSNFDLFRQWKLIHRDFGKITVNAELGAALEYAYVKFVLYYFLYVAREVKNTFFLKKVLLHIEKSLPNLKDILNNNVYFKTVNDVNKYLNNFVFRIKYLRNLPK